MKNNETYINYINLFQLLTPDFHNISFPSSSHPLILASSSRSETRMDVSSSPPVAVAHGGGDHRSPCHICRNSPTCPPKVNRVGVTSQAVWAGTAPANAEIRDAAAFKRINGVPLNRTVDSKNNLKHSKTNHDQPIQHNPTISWSPAQGMYTEDPVI